MPDVHPGIPYLVMGVVLDICHCAGCVTYFDAHADEMVDAATTTDIDP